MEQINIVKSIDVTATLLAIPLNTTVYCPHKLIDSQIVRTIASRLKKDRRGLYIVSSYEDGVSITRK